MADGKNARLLAVNDYSDFRTKHIFSRSEQEDSYTVNVENGVSDLIARLDQLVKDKMQFNAAVFSTHGYDGGIWFGNEFVSAGVLYDKFMNRGYETLFPYPHSRLYFAGCSVAAGDGGWGFLDAAARIFLRLGGGEAFGWTSLGFAFSFKGHAKHFTGNVRRVFLNPDPVDGGANLIFFDGPNRVDNGAKPY